MAARFEQYAFSTVMLILAILCVLPSAPPSLTMAPSFQRFAVAGLAFLLSGVSCSPRSDLALAMGAAGLAASTLAHLATAGFSLTRPGVFLELSLLVSAATLAAGALLAGATRAKKATPVTKSSLD